MKRICVKRCLSLLLCACMLFPILLTGCGEKGDGAGVTDPPAETEAPAADTECAHQFENEDPCDVRQCTLCGLYVRATHAYELAPEEAIAPTLQSVGQEVYRCTLCQKRRYVSTEKLKPAEFDMPVIYVEGSLAGISKETTVTVDISYVSEDRVFDCAATLKWQGASSIRYPKKNFSIKLYEDETLDQKFKVNFGWGKEYKYCLKANYVDSSHARNVVGARLYAQMLRSKTTTNPRLLEAPNCGAIDGFPVLLYINGDFYGLYTLNIPKDNWMMGMKNDENVREAILMGGQWGESCSMRQPMPATYGPDWELEHCSTEDDAWVSESFNRLITFVMENEGEDFRAGIEEYLDLEAAIDYLIFIYFIRAGDNGGKNILWVTFDGQTWIPSAYDLDGTFGINWDGTPREDEGLEMMPDVVDGRVIVQRNYCELWNRLFACYREEIKERYAELRADVLSLENIEQAFSAFFEEIPEEVYVSEAKNWVDIPAVKENRSLDALMGYMKKRADAMDDFFGRI